MVAVLLSVASLVVSHYLVRDLKREEQVKMETWAEAMRSLNSVEEVETISWRGRLGCRPLPGAEGAEQQQYHTGEGGGR